MTSDAKARLVAFGLVLGACASLGGAAAWITLDRFAVVERDGVRRSLLRARTAIEDYLVVLKGKAGDWAQWDEAYEFVVHPTPEWIESNVPTNSLVQLDLNLIVFLDVDGRTVFAKAVDAATGNPIPVPAPFDRQLPLDSPLIPPGDAVGGVSGAVMVGGRCLFAAARPILTSSGRGPARGTLVFARFLDELFVERLRSGARVDLSFRPYEGEPLPRDFREARDALGSVDDVRLEELGDERIAAFGLLAGLDGRPVLVTRVEIPREVRSVARSAAWRMAGAAVAVAAAFGAAVFLFVGSRPRRKSA
ncbi:MAG: hypothetical protein HY905_12760 [Deltaproteobacteria bacterium]|nr:hypothetical protein [Deltaproteobacteria bacterium]